MNWDARARARLGMAMFLCANGVLFALLLIAFISFRDAAAAAHNLNLPLGLALIACAVVGAIAVARAWVAVGIAAGAAFLMIQGADFSRLIAGNMTAAGSPFGTAYFTLTGMHALNVLVGVLALALVPALGDRRATALSAVSLYWYFLAAVWILIFGVAYLWSFL